MAKQKKKDKTNVMRLLDQEGLDYTPNTYDVSDGIVDGLSVAKKIGQDPDTVFKTLVCQGHSGQYAVFVIPVAHELDLKKGAKAAGEKSMAMIHQRDLLPLTGYVHGGCSPVGMKKAFATHIHESGKDLQRLYVSGGRVGTQVGLAPQDLAHLVHASFADLIKA